MDMERSEILIPRKYWAALDMEHSLDEQQSVTNIFQNDVLTSIPNNEDISNVSTTSIEFNEDMYRIIQGTANKSHIRPFDVFLFAWHSVLSAFSYVDCTVVGLDMSTSKGDRVIVPHVLLHERSNDAMPVVEMIRAVQQRESQLKLIVEQCKSATEGEAFGAIDNIFLYNTTSQFSASNSLTLNLIESEDKIKLSISYNRAEFQSDNVDLLLQTIHIVIEQIVNDPMKLLKDLTFIRVEEQSNLLNRQLLYKDHRYSRTIVDVFEDHVLRQPDAPALIFENKKFTYKELNVLANQLANFIISCIAIKPDTVIGFCVQHSELVLITMLGIWKTGAALTSIDSRFPEDRMLYILECVDASLVLTDETNFEKLSNLCRKHFLSCQIHNLSSCNFQQISSTENPQVNIKLNSLAYVIFTSGTTGTPKGVLVEHRNLSTDCRDILCPEDLRTNEVMLVTFYHGFVAFIICTSMVYGEGMALLLAPQGLTLQPQMFYDYSNTNSVTQIYATPSMVNSLDLSNIKTLRRVFLAGEVLREPVYNKMRSGAKSAKVINGIGCSEATVPLFADLTSYTPFFTHSVVNKCCFVLTRTLQCTPDGAIGELCVTGLHVARGYLNNEELSEKTFIKNPFAREGFERMFRTGDLVRRHTSGAIQYIGRRDSQIKLRGIRVELGDIEFVIYSAPGVKQCIVLPKLIADQKDVVLIAYVTGTLAATQDNIRKFIRTKLPEYMIPVHIVKLDNFPLNVNGKVNRAELLNTPITVECFNYVPPTEANHEMFAAIWENVLEIPKGTIGIHHSFFALGGNSLLAVKVVNELNRNLSSRIPATRLLTHTSIAQFFEELEICEEENENIEVVSRFPPDTLQLSYQQERFWVWDQRAGGLPSFNLSICLEVLPGFSWNRFKSAISAITLRHEVLRTLLKLNETGHAYQHASEIPLIPRTLKIQQSHLNEEVKKLEARKYNPAKDLPIQITAFEIDNELKYVVIVIHHIAFDFWSRDIFLDELCYFYNTPSNDAFVPLQIQYIDYAQNQRARISEKVNIEDMAYWKDAMNGYQVPRLPYDRPRQKDTEYFFGKKIPLNIGEEVSIKIRTLASQLNVSLFSVLLAGYFLMLRKFCKKDDIVVMSPFAGRNNFQTQNLIGLFMRELPLRQIINSNDSVKEFIQSVWNTSVLAIENQSICPEKLLEAIGHTTDPYRDRDVSQMFFQVNESKYDKSGFEFSIPLQVYEDQTSLDCPAYNMDLSAVLDLSNSEISGNFVYLDQLFDRVTALKFVDEFTLTLRQFAELGNQADAAERMKLCQLKLNVSTTFPYQNQNSHNIKHNHMKKSSEIQDVVFKPEMEAVPTTATNNPATTTENEFDQSERKRRETSDLFKNG